MIPIKVCFIPPTGLEDRMSTGDMVMGLAQRSYPSYVQVIQQLAAKNKFVIADNGANEGQRLPDELLAARANLLGANELVLPDVLRDSSATLAAVTSFLQQDLKKFDHYMAVVQGTSMEQLQQLVECYAEMPQVTTLGLPRLLLKFVKRSIRIDLANWIQAEHKNRFNLHLLGASSEWVREPYYAARYAPHIRSIDSSLPYNYGLKGELIDRTTRRIDRPGDYFTQSHSATHLTTIFRNEETYLLWSKGMR